MKPILQNGEITQKVINNIEKKYIYFAHMSVGYNILDGISELTDEINIQEINSTIEYGSPAFFHSKIGENTKPFLKIDDFSLKMINGMGDKTEITFLKLCYIDINSNTDIDSLFSHYTDTISKLQNQFPGIRFIHLTTPLITQQKGIKPLIKRIIGREVRGYEDNLNRQRYNELIRKNYTDVFDLAEIESTGPDGIRTEHSLNGETYYSLIPEYTDDGGHLNKEAGKMVAGRLLFFISELEQE